MIKRMLHHSIGGVFLWHSPHGHPHWALPSKLGYRGARTFLNQAFPALSRNALIAIASPAFKVHNDSEHNVCSIGAVAQLDRATVS